MRGKGRLAIAGGLVVLASLGFLWLRGPAGPQQPAVVRPKTQAKVAASEVARIADGSLSGSVHGSDGKAIPQARVCATTVRSEVSWTPASTCTTTDGAGHYLIAPLASTAYVVSATAEGFRSSSALVGGDISLGPGEGKTGVDIVLERGGARLAGRVLDATGGPVSGAMVRVLRRALPHDTTVASSGPDGSFAVWIAPGPVTVMADAAAYVPARVAHVAPSSDLVLRLTPGATLSGRVVAKGTGEPVADVRIRAIPSNGWPDPTRPSATSDSGGAFQIQGLEPGSYALLAEGLGWRGESPPIDLGLAKSVDGVTVTVAPATIVSGKVVHADRSEPCSRGSVTLGPNDSSPPGRNATRPAAPVPMMVAELEADGSARLTAVPPGSYRVDVDCADAFLTDGPATLEVGPDKVDGVIWKVTRGARVLVRTVDGADRPAGNVLLYVREGSPGDEASKSGEGRPRPPLLSFSTGADGAYELTGLSPRLYTIEPSPEHKGQPATVDARQANKIETTVHLEGRGSIVVTVRTPQGTGVDQVEVGATPAEPDATSPAFDRDGKPGAPGTVAPRAFAPRLRLAGTGVGNGRFEIGPLAEGLYRVTVNDGINPPAEPIEWPQGLVRVGPGITQATVVLRRGGVLTGRVVDGAGQPLSDVWVTADCSAPPGGSRGRRFASTVSAAGSSGRTISDLDGRFRIERIASEARCTLRAEQPDGGGIAVVKGVQAGSDTAITIAALGSLSGTAKRSDGTPVTSFQLSVRDPGGAMRTETVTSTDGHWSLSRVNPGRMQILAFEPSLGDAQARVELAPGERRDGVELQFPPASQPGALVERQP